MAIKRCKSPFSVWKNGVPRVITGGQLIEDTDPVYKGHEHLFEDVETFMSEKAERSAPVEQATAAPGEKRAVASRTSRAASKSPAKKADDDKG
ncbi:hypothetical protein [Streptomyces himalayensis]|uniref:Uncharacterized protein n=1 Tax=Streptomyces himalayensis subsp. himalayensis TaxID=2756131 RepID=A0A7W0IE03_9ACTN|nr:hypothetical protein [Streptomyces himalayensis]MBA2951591.1 hypothetical protein [Streptomyces himalayensis subsp. himalayensis]